MIALPRALGAAAAVALGVLALVLGEGPLRAAPFAAFGAAALLAWIGRRTPALLALLAGGAALAAVPVASLGLAAGAVALLWCVALVGALHDEGASDAASAWWRTAAIGGALVAVALVAANWRPTREIVRGADVATLVILLAAASTTIALALAATSDEARET